MVIEKRARKPEQKRERRTEILSAAITLLRERPYNKINIADVARRAGMAKGTVFLYFRTREELFLSSPHVSSTSGSKQWTARSRKSPAPRKSGLRPRF